MVLNLELIFPLYMPMNGLVSFVFEALSICKTFLTIMSKTTRFDSLFVLEMEWWDSGFIFVHLVSFFGKLWLIKNLEVQMCTVKYVTKTTVIIYTFIRMSFTLIEFILYYKNIGYTVANQHCLSMGLAITVVLIYR